MTEAIESTALHACAIETWRVSGGIMNITETCYLINLFNWAKKSNSKPSSNAAKERFHQE